MTQTNAKLPAVRLYLYLPAAIKLKLEIMARLEYRSLNAEVTKALVDWAMNLPDNDPEYVLLLADLEAGNG